MECVELQVSRVRQVRVEHGRSAPSTPCHRPIEPPLTCVAPRFRAEDIRHGFTSRKNRGHAHRGMPGSFRKSAPFEHPRSPPVAHASHSARLAGSAIRCMRHEALVMPAKSRICLRCSIASVPFATLRSAFGSSVTALEAAQSCPLSVQSLNRPSLLPR